MKKIVLMLFLAAFSKAGFSQSQPAPLIWGVSPFQDSIWAMDTITWLPTINLEPTVTGSFVSGSTGLAYDPIAYKSYAILKANGTRYLAEISLETGSCTVKGDLGDSFSSITFDKFGQLYGSTGDGANVPSTLYKIDKATATSTLMFAMGNGFDGEVICYNRFDNKMYHWSGNGTVVYESWPIASTSYTPTNITISGTTGGETFGALFLKANDFLISNINSNFRHASTTGVYGNSLSFNPDDLRGLIMPPRFATSTPTLCAGNGSLEVFSNCTNLYDSVYYYWGDGNVTQLLATSAVTAAAAHNYTSTGIFTLTVQLFNGAVPKSTFTTYTIQVNTNPSVTISGSSNLCPGATLTLSGSSGGSSQWYNGGVLISGATSNTISITSPGFYNMVKTNQNGCADSANVGHQVVIASNPTVAVNNATICSGSNYTIAPTGAASYTISGGSTVVNPTITTSYSVTGTSSAGCVSGNTAVATISVNPLPTLSLSTNNATICVGESATLTAGGASQYTWNTTAGSNTLAINPTVSTSYTLTGTSTEGCANTATVSQVVSECVGIAENKTKTTDIRVMPNPSTGKFFIENLSENAKIEVYDAVGRLILKTNSQSGKSSIDLEAYNAGIYILRVNQGEKTLNQIKLIKE